MTAPPPHRPDEQKARIHRLAAERERRAAEQAAIMAQPELRSVEHEIAVRRIVHVCLVIGAVGVATIVLLIGMWFRA